MMKHLEILKKIGLKINNQIKIRLNIANNLLKI